VGRHTGAGAASGQTLRGKVEVLRDSAFSTIAAAVEISTADGNTHGLSQPAARGNDVNPMSDSDIEAKLRSAAAGWDPRYDVAPRRCDLGTRQKRRCFQAGFAGCAPDLS
jgi:hypothetical protein